MVNVDGRIQKNGGNVSSCFCTADGRVIHAIGKPVSPEQLLEAAQWAEATYRRMQEVEPANLERQTTLVRAAHLAELNTNLQQYQKRYQAELAPAQQAYAQKVRDARQRQREGYRTASRPTEPAITAARKAANSFGGKRGHQALAAEPLAPLEQVSAHLFQKLTGEVAAEQRGRVFTASAGLKQAREHHLPILFVLYKGHGKYQDELNHETKRILNEVFPHPLIQPAIRKFVVVLMPLRELAALTQLEDLPPFEFSSNHSANLIVTGSDGHQVAAFDGQFVPEQLVSTLWEQAHLATLTQVEAMAEKELFSEALKRLRSEARFPANQEQRVQMEELAQEITLQLAEKREQEEKITEALRLYQRVADTATDGFLKEHARKQVERLQQSN